MTAVPAKASLSHPCGDSESACGDLFHVPEFASIRVTMILNRRAGVILNVFMAPRWPRFRQALRRSRDAYLCCRDNRRASGARLTNLS